MRFDYNSTSIESVNETESLFGGIGVTIFDSESEDTRLWEVKKVLGVEDFTTPEVSELIALIEGLKLALEFGLRNITFYCDNDEVLGYVSALFLTLGSCSGLNVFVCIYKYDLTCFYLYVTGDG